MTKVNRILSKLLEKWYIKVLCVIIAFFLYIFHQSSMLVKHTFVLPLKIEENGSFMALGKYQNEVTVTVRTDAEDSTNVTANLISASVNLDEILEGGTYTLPVHIKLNESLLKLDPLEVKVRPETIKVKVDKKNSKYLKVEPSVVGEPAYGYEVESVLVEPAFALVEGPSSLVNIEEFVSTTGIDISDKIAPLEAQVDALELNKLIKLDEKGPYKVSVNIQPIMMEKSFDSIGITVKNLKTGLELKEVPPVIGVKLSGPITVLEDFLLTSGSVAVDCSNVLEPGSYELPVRISVPAGVKILEATVQIATIEVVAEPADEIELDVNPEDLQEDILL